MSYNTPDLLGLLLAACGIGIGGLVVARRSFLGAMVMMACSGGMMAQEQERSTALVAPAVIWLKVRGIALRNRRILVQRPTADPDACYAFIGGSYEVGDTFAERLRIEFSEETNATVVDSRYLFVVERRRLGDRLDHELDHFFQVTLDRKDVESREAHLAQHWLPVASLKDYDLRPWVVRDVIAEGRLHNVRHLVELLEDG
jgi:8-oxo-dGTP pyrophosphatase MutT (NUDIX family)